MKTVYCIPVSVTLQTSAGKSTQYSYFIVKVSILHCRNTQNVLKVPKVESAHLAKCPISSFQM